MSKLSKLAKIASKGLKSGEVFKAKTVGQTVVQTAGGEFVDAFVGATDHNVVVMTRPLFGKKRLQTFSLSQAAVPLLDEDKNSISLALPGEVFVVTDVSEEPDPKDLVKFIRDKKSAGKTTFEATNLTVSAKK